MRDVDAAAHASPAHRLAQDRLHLASAGGVPATRPSRLPRQPAQRALPRRGGRGDGAPGAGRRLPPRHGGQGTSRRCDPRRDAGAARGAARRGHDLLVSEERVGRTGSRPELLVARLRALRSRAEAWGFERLAVIRVARRTDRWLASRYARMSDPRRRPSPADFEGFVASVLDAADGRYGLGVLLACGAPRDHVAEVWAPQTGWSGSTRRWRRLRGAFSTGFSARSAPRPSARRRWREAVEGVRGRPLARGGLAPAAEAGAPARRRARLRPPSLGHPGAGGRVLRAYERSNRRLAAAAGLDLRRHGYFSA